MYVVWTYIYEYLSECVRPYNKEEMKDTYTNLTYVFYKCAQRTKLTREIIISFLEKLIFI